MRQLPIYELEEEVVRALQRDEGRARLILSAPTGSGKSTQIPQILLDRVLGDDIRGEIVVLQPRRIAARLLASRVASERGVSLGEEVGYQVRLESKCGAATRIRYVTEGILLRQLLTDPELGNVAAVVFDEFHERHLYGDITLARIAALQEAGRPDLKMVIMSATLDVEALEDYLAPCARLESEGRTFPVEVQYLAPVERQKRTEVWDRAAAACARAAAEQREGDMLVFMPGGYEIRRTIESLQRGAWARGWRILPLHGELPPAQQDEAVKRYRERKIIVATNVAETSLTIEGVRIVVDSGVARIPDFDPHRGINTLTVRPISRASAEQRAGRAGRTAPGVCIRLWSEKEHGTRPEREESEIARMDLSEVVLTLKAQGIDDVRGFRWLEAPQDKALRKAEELLQDLGAIEAAADGGGAITQTGRRMLAFPVHPRFARMLVAADRLGCVQEACLIAALAQGRPVFVRRKQRGSDLTREDYTREEDISDYQPMIRALETAADRKFRGDQCAGLGIHGVACREAWNLSKQFLRLAARNGLKPNPEPAPVEHVARTILAGFADHVGARVSEGSQVFALVHGRRGKPDPDSVTRKASLLVATEIAEIEGKELQVRLSNLTALEETWLGEVFPDHTSDAVHCFYDAAQKRVVARRERRFRDLVIGSASGGEPGEEEAAAILAEQVIKGELKLKKWDQSVERWIARLRLLGEWMPEFELPGFDESDRQLVIGQVCQGARSYREIRDRPIWPSLKSWLSAGQQETLDAYAPERIALCNGRSAKVQYDDKTGASIALTVQNLYGVEETPRIADGKVPVQVQILAPNQRPIQVTKDLASFWRSGYAEVKKQLQGRYPKHEWR